MPQFPLRLPTRNEAALIALLLVVLLFSSWLRRGEKISALEAQLAAKPLVSNTAKTAESSHQETGRVTIVEKFLPAPAATPSCPAPVPQLAERTTVKDPVVTDTKSETETAHTEVPICPGPYVPNHYFAGVLMGPSGFGGSWVEGARAGVTVADSWDLGASLRRESNGRLSPGGEVSFRWR